MNWTEAENPWEILSCVLVLILSCHTLVTIHFKSPAEGCSKYCYGTWLAPEPDAGRPPVGFKKCVWLWPVLSLIWQTFFTHSSQSCGCGAACGAPCLFMVMFYIWACCRSVVRLLHWPGLGPLMYCVWDRLLAIDMRSVKFHSVSFFIFNVLPSILTCCFRENDTIALALSAVMFQSY